MTSSIYRECGQIDNALVALDEAEKMLLNLSKLQHNIRNQESKIFREIKQSTFSSGFWKEADPVLARFQADVALEVIYYELKVDSVEIFYSIRFIQFANCGQSF